MRAYEFISEARASKEYDPRDIADVKYAYDEGHTYSEIATLLGIPVNDVTVILGRHYPERKRRAEHLRSALTDGDKETIVFDFMDGRDISAIADDIGIAPSLARWVLNNNLGEEEVKQELARRRTEPGRMLKNKVTPEMIAVMRAGYVDGKSPYDISDELGNVVSHGTVLNTLRKEPDWLELRAKWEERRRAVRHAAPAATNIYRPGTIGNRMSKGPGSRHTSGVNWPKYGE